MTLPSGQVRSGSITALLRRAFAGGAEDAHQLAPLRRADDEIGDPAFQAPPAQEKPEQKQPVEHPPEDIAIAGKRLTIQQHADDERVDECASGPALGLRFELSGLSDFDRPVCQRERVDLAGPEERTRFGYRGLTF